ncbi:MAG: hypothetical protein ACWGOV_05950 [Acidiferrobacterales bacterium]
MEKSRLSHLFDYKTLRFLLGLVAFCFPFAVSLASSARLNSISAAYYSEAKYIYIGTLILVAVFLLAYSGHSVAESRVSRIASVTAVLTLLFPAACTNCSENFSSRIHFISSAILFLILAYFCLVPFQKGTRGAPGKRARRSLIYRICGWTMLGCIAGLFFANIFLTVSTINKFRLTYYGQAISLIAFGIAWMVSSKMSRFIADEDELFNPLGKWTEKTGSDSV